MKNTQSTGAQPPFSYPVKVATVSVNPAFVKLEANPDECRGLARLWQVLSVEFFRAELQVVRWKRDGVRVTGKVQAAVTQACVVTTEPVPATISEEFEQIFVPEGSKLAKIVASEASETLLDPDAPDLPDLFVGDTIDVGALVAEFAALALDPYPRKQGVEFADHLEGDDAAGSGRPNPFAVLKDWKKD